MTSSLNGSMRSEFSVIDRFFKKQSQNTQIRLGIGDDCALLSLPQGDELAVTTDTMVENVHFFADVNPYALGHKLLAVNLSDLAAMAAKPIAVTLALTLPNIDEHWLAQFSAGFFALAACYGVDLIGGDTTQGPLTLTLQAMGTVPIGQALTRRRASVGDLICMSGFLGEAGLGLKMMQQTAPPHESALLRFHQPIPRVETGLALRGVATACIDISDGLASDLGHILWQSQVGACLEWDKLPLSEAVHTYIAQTGDYLMPLSAGDDYELCFTVPVNKRHEIPHGCTVIGVIEQERGLRLKKQEKLEILTVKGYAHFS